MSGSRHSFAWDLNHASFDHARLRLSSGKGYSMYLAVARATVSPCCLATTRSAVSMPAEIPADVITLPASTTC